MTVNETHIFSQRSSTRRASATTASTSPSIRRRWSTPTRLGINVGQTTMPIALPQITITGPGLNFGGPADFPQGRTVTTFAVGDTATYLRGNHIVKFGGEVRRVEALQLQRRSRARFTYPSVAAFQQGFGNAFSITLGDRGVQRLRQRRRRASSRTAISLGSNLKLDLGLRYDYLPSPTEAGQQAGRFDPATASLLQIGAGGFDQMHEERQRLPAARRRHLESDRRRQDSSVRGAYAVMVNQSNTGYFAGDDRQSAARHAAFQAAGTAASNIKLDTADRAGVRPRADVHRPELPARPDADVERQRRARDRRGLGLMVGYFGSHGDRLRIPININQFVPSGRASVPEAVGDEPDSRRARRSATSPNRRASAGRNYKGLWLTANRRMTTGCSFGSYTLSKSTDTNSYDGHADVAAEQLRPRRQRRRRRTSTSGTASRVNAHLRAAVPRQPAEGRLAGRRRRAGADREPVQHRHEHQDDSPAPRPCGRI